jgi:hypothetical protein
VYGLAAESNFSPTDPVHNTGIHLTLASSVTVILGAFTSNLESLLFAYGGIIFSSFML